MLQFYLNYQLIIGLYKANTNASDMYFHQSFTFFSHFWHKIESLNFINNLNFKYRLLSIIFFTCLFLIIKTKSKCIELVNTTKFNSDY